MRVRPARLLLLAAALLGGLPALALEPARNASSPAGRGVDSEHSFSVTAGAPSFACGARRSCGQMRSCAEARFHLQQCGMSQLDGDGDGVPCESLCRQGR
jgi:hypothetical protein